MMTKPLRPHHTRKRTTALAAVVALAAAGVAFAVGLVGTPYAHVADELLERLHAERVACPVSFGGTAVCFVAEPARAAPLAEALDMFVADHGGALVIGPWQSGNGAHTVTLRWDDDLWGGLEVWFAEQGERRVEGRLEHVVRRRD